VKPHKPFCAVCVDRPADRMDTLEPGGVEFPMCNACATQAVRDPEVQVTLRRPYRRRV
jgi:hypothetical protein